MIYVFNLKYYAHCLKTDVKVELEGRWRAAYKDDALSRKGHSTIDLRAKHFKPQLEVRITTHFARFSIDFSIYLECKRQLGEDSKNIHT